MPHSARAESRDLSTNSMSPQVPHHKFYATSSMPQVRCHKCDEGACHEHTLCSAESMPHVRCRNKHNTPRTSPRADATPTRAASWSRQHPHRNRPLTRDPYRCLLLPP
eukprot:1447482-Rhodomonas_salina.1